MSCSVRRRNGRPPGRAGAAREARWGWVGDGTKRGSRAGECPAREPYNLPLAKLSFMGRVIICLMMDDLDSRPE